MATEPLSDVYVTATDRETERAPKPETGSAWWAELAFGAACSFTAVGFALAHTAVGPFSEVMIVYPTVVSVAYLAFASVLSVVFVRSGLRGTRPARDPDAVDPAGTTDPDTLETIRASSGSPEDR